MTEQLVTASKETQKKEIIREFFKYLLDTDLSFRALENESFRRFLTLLDAPKELTTMSRKSVTVKLENLCEAAKKELIQKLRSKMLYLCPLVVGRVRIKGNFSVLLYTLQMKISSTTNIQWPSCQ
jgi:hypothetical protein